MFFLSFVTVLVPLSVWHQTLFPNVTAGITSTDDLLFLKTTTSTFGFARLQLLTLTSPDEHEFLCFTAVVRLSLPLTDLRSDQRLLVVILPSTGCCGVVQP